MTTTGVDSIMTTRGIQYPKKLRIAHVAVPYDPKEKGVESVRHASALILGAKSLILNLADPISAQEQHGRMESVGKFLRRDPAHPPLFTDDLAS